MCAAPHISSSSHSITGSGVPEEKVEAFQDQCRRQYGQDAALNPRNIIEAGKFQITTPEVKITVPPEYSYMVEARIIDGPMEERRIR